MNNKYTFLTLLAAFAFILGSMAGMNFILTLREEQLLSGNGQVVMDSPVLAWQKYGNIAEDESQKDADDEGRTLTIEQMEDAVISWNGRVGVILHNPVEGQISMEEAIEAAEDWLVKMGFWEEGDENKESYHVKATLGVGTNGTITSIDTKQQLEPYYSFWTIRFANENKIMVLDLNAVTGGIWRAEMILTEDALGQKAYGKTELFAKLAGLQVAEGIVSTDGQDNQVMFKIEGSRLFAHKLSYSMAITEATYFESGEGIQNQDKIIYLLSL